MTCMQDAFAEWKPGTALPPGERLLLDMTVLDPSAQPVVTGPTKQCTLCRAVREEELFRLNRRGRREPYCSACEKLRSQASAVGLSMRDLRTAVSNGCDLRTLIARSAHPSDSHVLETQLLCRSNKHHLRRTYFMWQVGKASVEKLTSLRCLKAGQCCCETIC